MELADDLLLYILAATDALFVPDRDPMAFSRHTVIYERRRDFPHGGVPWASEKVLPGVDETGRKQVQRALEDLVLRSLALSYQPRGAKTLGVRLTDEGDAQARALVGLPGLTTAASLMAELADLERGPEACLFLGRVWVPETILAGVRWGDNERRKAFVDVEEKLLPALMRGWVVSNCSVRGHCWYSLTRAGHQQLTKSVPTPITVPSPSDDARREYYYHIQVELQALYMASPECDREIGEIPMPVCPIRRAHMAAT